MVKCIVQLTTAVALLGWLLLLQTVPARAQPAEQAQSILGVWTVVVEGEPETRTLVIEGAAPLPDGLLLEAKYNLSSRKPTPIQARVLLPDGKRQLLLTTQAGSTISALEQPDGNYSGTFTTKSGKPLAVTVSRSLSPNPPMASPRKDPLAEVPLSLSTTPACAAFHGSWRGTWAQSGVGEVPMKVLEASSQGEKCLLRLIYGSWKTPITVETSGSTLSFLCNRTTQGTCNFRATGGELWGSYSNPGGGTNSGVFRRVAAQ